MILDVRVIERDKKIVFQKYLCTDFSVVDGYMQFSVKKAKWVDVCEVNAKNLNKKTV